jgi:hypothetical protein
MSNLDTFFQNQALASFLYSLDEVHVLAFLLGSWTCGSVATPFILFSIIIGRWFFLLRYAQLLDD